MEINISHPPTTASAARLAFFADLHCAPLTCGVLHTHTPTHTHTLPPFGGSPYRDRRVDRLLWFSSAMYSNPLRGGLIRCRGIALGRIIRIIIWLVGSRSSTRTERSVIICTCSIYCNKSIYPDSFVFAVMWSHDHKRSACFLWHIYIPRYECVWMTVNVYTMWKVFWMFDYFFLKFKVKHFDWNYTAL